MRRVLALLVGIIVGLVLAGAVAPLAVALVPPELRGPRLVWFVGSATVLVAAVVSWVVAAAPRE
jgi:hypothetical protein